MQNNNGGATTAEAKGQLQAISEVKANVKKLEEEVEDPAFIEEMAKDDSKAKVGFEEGSLGLLTQLDDVQTSDPVVRKNRKSVVREVVALQEDVDNRLEHSGEQTGSSSGVTGTHSGVTGSSSGVTGSSSGVTGSSPGGVRGMADKVGAKIHSIGAKVEEKAHRLKS